MSEILLVQQNMKHRSHFLKPKQFSNDEFTWPAWTRCKICKGEIITMWNDMIAQRWTNQNVTKCHKLRFDKKYKIRHSSSRHSKLVWFTFFRETQENTLLTFWSNHIAQGWRIPVLESFGPVDFSSKPCKNYRKVSFLATLQAVIGLFRCVRLGLGLNSAGPTLVAPDIARSCHFRKRDIPVQSYGSISLNPRRNWKDLDQISASDENL